MGVAAIKFAPGWVDRVEPGRPFRMTKGAALKDQTSRRKLRDMGELHSPDDVAKRLKVRRETILDYLHKGDARGRKLGYFKIGRHYRISDAHLEEFLA